MPNESSSPRPWMDSPVIREHNERARGAPKPCGEALPGRCGYRWRKRHKDYNGGYLEHVCGLSYGHRADRDLCQGCGRSHRRKARKRATTSPLDDYDG